MDKTVPDRFNVTLLEEDVLRFWQTPRIHDLLSAHRLEAQPFTLLSFPPYAAGKPGLPEVYAQSHQDLWMRYKCMRGFRALRRAGWNGHGLPVELPVENQFALTSRAQIELLGMGRFNEACRQLALESVQDQERLVERLGMQAAGTQTPVTLTDQSIEAVWGMFKQAWERGLLYQSEAVTPYCPRCGSLLAEDEAALETDEADVLAAYLRLPLLEDPGTALLVWTDRLWSLPGNVAVAVNPEAEYTIIERNLPEDEAGKDRQPEKLILARALLETVFSDQAVRVYETFRGSKLKGIRYRPLFQFMLPDKPAHRVVLGEFDLGRMGSGVRQLAPAFDADDLQLARQHDLPVITPLNPEGNFVSEVRPWRGMFFKQAESYILQDLQLRGLLYRAETLRQAVRSCWGCGSPLLPYVRNGWYLRSPQGAADWAVSRERFWGTPLPLWQCRQCARQVVVGSLQELSHLAGKQLAGMDLHRPAVDEVAIACPDCEGLMRRLPLVLDAAWDGAALALPSTLELETTASPADLVCEPGGQADHWLYALDRLSSLSIIAPPYHHRIALPTLLSPYRSAASDLPPLPSNPWDIVHDYGADTLRWAFFSHTAVGTSFHLTDELLCTVRSDFIQPLWDAYAFLVNSAVLSGWKPDPAGISVQDSASLLARWLLSRVNLLVKDTTAALERADVRLALDLLQAFVTDLAGWYVPLCRRVVLKDAGVAQRDANLTVLYQAFTTLNQLLAPFIPFLTEEFYQRLVHGFGLRAPLSVHLLDWPVVNETAIDAQLNHCMLQAQALADLGQAARTAAGVAARQPLAGAVVTFGSSQEAQAMQPLTGLLASGLWVEQVQVEVDEALGAPDAVQVALDTRLTARLVQEALADEFSRRILDFRQKAGLPAEASIRLFVTATPRLAQAISLWQARIMAETRCTELNLAAQPSSQPPGATATAGAEQGRAARRLYTMLEFEGERVTFGIEKVLDP